jgi:chromosome segregation ATPase
LQLKTIKGALSKLRVRPVITDIGESHNRIASLQIKVASLEGKLQLLEGERQSLEGELEYKQANIINLSVQVDEKQNHISGLYHEIHSLSTSRKRMVKQFIKRTLPFLNSFF